MEPKRITISIVLATLMLVSLFAVASSAASVSGQANALATTPPDGILAGTGPAATTLWPNGQTDVFAVDTSGTLWNVSGLFGSGNPTWNSLGGVCTASPAAVSWGNMGASYLRIDVFVRGTNGAVWWKYYQDGWSSWQSLGGQLASGTGPAVASWSAGRLDLFVEGTNGALYHKWYTGGTWSGWQNLGGKLTASPAATWEIAASGASNNIHVFARGTDGACWEKIWSGTAWSSWKSLGGQLASGTGPAVSQDLRLIVQGTDGQLWQKNYDQYSGWAAWRTLSGAPPEALSTSSPAASLMVNDNTIVCVSTTSGNVWYSGALNFEIWSSAGSPP